MHDPNGNSVKDGPDPKRDKLDNAADEQTGRSLWSLTEESQERALFWERWHKNVRDADDERREITKETKLVKLAHIGRNDYLDRNLAWDSQELNAQFFMGGKKMPDINFEAGEVRKLKGLTLKMMISELTAAPAIKIRVNYLDTSVSMSIIASAFFSIPFTGDRELKNFKFTHTAELFAYLLNFSFECHGAFKTKGVAILGAQANKFSAVDRELWKFLLSMTSSTYTPTAMTLKVYQPHTKATMSRKIVNNLGGRVWNEISEEEKKAFQSANLAVKEARDPVFAEFDDILRRTLQHLPNGPDKAYVPESFFRLPYFAFRSKTNGITVQANQMPTPYQLMKKKFNTLPATMVPFLAVDSFRSYDELRVKMSQGTEGEYREDKFQFQALCSPSSPHTATFYSMGGIPFAIIKFMPFKVLDHAASVPIRIPGGAKVELNWQSNLNDHLEKAKGIVISLPFPATNCDLAILINDRNTASFGSGAADNAESKAMAKTWDGRQNAFAYDVELSIKPNDAVYKQNMATINILGSPAAQKWRQFVLNQQPIEVESNYNPSQCPKVNVSENEENMWQAKVDQAYNYILSWHPKDNPDFKLNAEQLEVISKVRGDTSLLMLVAGPAATGKTTVQQMIVAFFLSIGVKVIFDAPTNTNVSHFMEAMQKNFPEFEALCAAPRSTESSLNTMSRSEPLEIVTPGDFADEVLFDFMNALRIDAQTKHHDSKRFNLQTRVFAEAKNHTIKRLKHSFKYGEREDDTDVYTGLHSSGQWLSDVPDHITEVEDDQNERFDHDKDHGNNSIDENRFSMPSLAECHELPDHVLEFPLPDGWTCKQHKSSDAEDAIITLLYIHENAERSIIHPLITADNDKTKDAYDELERFILRAADQKISNWIDEKTGQKDEQAIKNFHYVYTLCCKIKLAHSNFLCGTSASVCGKLVRTHWASGKYGAGKPLGVVVVKEEAAKDIEPNFWGSIVYNCWAHLVTWVVAFGDVEQLAPTVTGSSGIFQTSHANAQLKVSFFTRAISEGMHHHQLLEQARMHQDIVAIPNKMVYGGKLRTAKCCTKTLAQSPPNCQRVVSKLKAMFTAAGDENSRDLDEATLRNHAFNVPGTVAMNPVTGSKVNMDQIMFVVNVVVPAMYSIFTDSTSENCKIIVGYTLAVDCITAEFVKIRSADKSITRKMQPRVQTFDSSQGTEARWVCSIYTCDKAEKRSDLFFMQDNNRVNVSLTRAIDIQTIVAGRMMGQLFDDADIEDNSNNHKIPLLVRAFKQIVRDDTGFLVTNQQRVKLPAHLRKL